MCKQDATAETPGTSSAPEEQSEVPRQGGETIDFFAVGEHDYAVIELSAGSRQQLFASLTQAETDVAKWLAKGKTNREIAGLRQTTERTVINQVSSIFCKLEVGSRAEFGRALHRKPSNTGGEED